jgi:uncharacterized protein
LTTAADLTSQTKAELAKAAKNLKISGAASMSKEQLIAALSNAAKGKASEPSATKPENATKPDKKTTKARPAGASRRQSSAKKSKPASKPSASTTVKANEAAPQRSTKRKAAGSKSKSSKATPTTAAESAAKPESNAKGSKRAAKPKSSAIGATKPEKKRPATKRPTAATAKVTAAEPAASKSKPADKKAEKKPGKQATKTSTTTTSPKVLKKIRELQLQRESEKDIAFRPTLVRPPGASEPIWEKEPQKDRIGLFVRDPYWLHASWDITRNAVERARAALAEQWHTSKPILRLLRLDDNSTSSPSEMVERDIEIHGGLRNWYIPWTGVATSFRVLVGYLAANGRFHAIAKSNIVKTIAAGSADAVDQHWSDVGPESERIYAMSGGYDSEHETAELREILEERVHRNLGAPALAKLGVGAESGFRRRSDFHFDMEVEMVIYGSTLPDGFLTLNGEPVSLRGDGSFAVRLPFPDRRQVLPAVACTRDGSQQRTIVIAVERNTKIMEPLEQERDTGD